MHSEIMCHFLGQNTILQNLVHQEGSPVHLNPFNTSFCSWYFILPTFLRKLAGQHLHCKSNISIIDVFNIQSPFSPLKVWNFSFIDYERDISPSLFKIRVGSSPTLGIPIIHIISEISIDVGGSILDVPPWMQLRSNFTQALIFRLRLECGISIRFSMLSFSNLVSHTYVSSNIVHVLGTLLVHKYFSLDSSRNFFSSVIS
jgi:hypothetical protein